VRISASILSADLARLGEQLRALEATGHVECVHVDVMDGIFVPNISIGIPIVEAVRRSCDLPIAVHLMIVSPDRYVERFVDAGASLVAVHVEACPHLHRDLALIARAGARPAVAINPGTAACALDAILPDVAQVLVMSVNPGFGGQAFLPQSLRKIAQLRRMCDERGLAVEIAVDGGVNADTAPAILAAGADVLVVGSALFARGSLEDAVAAIANAARP
jgi:ribulose-phosphate 3-epimerase